MKIWKWMNDYKFVKVNNGIEESYFWVRCEEKDVEDIFIGVLKIIKKIKENGK